MKTVIIAAGLSSRIKNLTNGNPKTLLPFGKGTILSTIINNFSSCGITDFVIVVGCEREKICQYVEQMNSFNLNITFITNEDWEKGNGISVLAAEPVVEKEPFLLSMSDHLVSSSAINALLLCQSVKNLLLVDQRIETIFDINDATKVLLDGKRIVQIGKELQQYNGIDCGVFRLTSRYFSAMREQLHQGKESISAAIQGLIANDDMEAVLMKKNEEWIDIDTPEAYEYAAGGLF